MVGRGRGVGAAGGSAGLDAQEGSGRRAATRRSPSPPTSRPPSRTGIATAKRAGTRSTPDAPFGLPYRPTPFYVQVTLGFGADSGDVFVGQPVQYRYEGNIFSGEKRAELLVVPALSVRVSPDVAIVPLSRVTRRRRPRDGAAGPWARGAAGARYAGRRPRARGAAGRGAAPAAPTAGGLGRRPARGPRDGRQRHAGRSRRAVVKLDAAARAGRRRPREQTVTFTREDESQTVRFQVQAGDGRRRRRVHDRARRPRSRTGASTAATRSSSTRTSAGSTSTRRRRDVKVIDVKIAPNLTVGYIMGVGDDVPPAIEQLGAKVEMITAEDLAWGNLSSLQRHRHRRARLRAPRRPAREQQPAARLRPRRRHAHRAVQQVRVQRGAVRSVSRPR